MNNVFDKASAAEEYNKYECVNTNDDDGVEVNETAAGAAVEETAEAKKPKPNVRQDYGNIAILMFLYFLQGTFLIFSYIYVLYALK